MGKTFRDIKKDDTMYMVIVKDNYSINDKLTCYVYSKIECTVTDIQHITEKEKNYGDMWTPDIRKISCDIYHICYKIDGMDNVVDINLANEPIDATLLYYSGCMYDNYKSGILYVNEDDADQQVKVFNREQYLIAIKYYNNCRQIISNLSDALHIDNITSNGIIPVGSNEKTLSGKNMKVGIFPGTFNPFTIGHKNIVDKALTIFDKVIIAFGVNPDKETNDKSLQSRIKAVKAAFKDQNVSVIKYDTLTMDIAKKHKATIIRGIRNASDFEYEKNVADANKKMGNIDTVFFMADPEYGHISSTLIRELEKYNKEVTGLIV